MPVSLVAFRGTGSSSSHLSSHETTASANMRVRTNTMTRASESFWATCSLNFSPNLSRLGLAVALCLLATSFRSSYNYGEQNKRSTEWSRRKKEGSVNLKFRFQRHRNIKNSFNFLVHLSYAVLILHSCSGYSKWVFVSSVKLNTVKIRLQRK